MTESIKKVLVTGAKGMLGQRVMEACPTHWEILGADLEEFDITSLKATMDFLAPIRADLVINCAAMTDVDGCESQYEKAYLINGVGAGNLARAASESDAEIIQISTDYVFDGDKTQEYFEDDTLHPVSAYGRTKLAGERFVAANNLKHWSVRTQWLYGPGGKNFVDTILRVAQERPQLEVVNDQIGCPTYTVDLAREIIRIAVQRPPYGIYHCSNNGSCSWFDFACAIIEGSGLDKVEVKPITSDRLTRPARRPPHSVLRNFHLHLTIGDEMRHWKEALQDYLRLKKDQL